MIFKHYLAAWNNDCSRFRVRIKEKDFICWLIIKKPQPNLHSGNNYLGPEGVPWIEVPLSFLSVHTICSGCPIFVSCEIFCHIVISCRSFLGGNEVLSKIIVSSSFLFPPFAANFSQYPPNGELTPRVQKLWHGSFHTVLKKHVFVFHCSRVLKQPMWRDLMEALCKEASMHVSTWQNDALMLPIYLEIKKWQ